MLKFRWLAVGIGWWLFAAGASSAQSCPAGGCATPPSECGGCDAGCGPRIGSYADACQPRRIGRPCIAWCCDWLSKPHTITIPSIRDCCPCWPSGRLYAWLTYRPLCKTIPGECVQEHCHPPVYTYFEPSKYNRPLEPVCCEDTSWSWPIWSYLTSRRGCGSCRPGLINRCSIGSCSSCSTPAACPTGCASGCSACDSSHAYKVQGRLGRLPVLAPSVFRKCEPQAVPMEMEAPAVEAHPVVAPPAVQPEPLPMPKKQ
jgi:hypothetical protein